MSSKKNHAARSHKTRRSRLRGAVMNLRGSAPFAVRQAVLSAAASMKAAKKNASAAPAGDAVTEDSVSAVADASPAEEAPELVPEYVPDFHPAQNNSAMPAVSQVVAAVEGSVE